jgi:hypothetical protein
MTNKASTMVVNLFTDWALGSGCRRFAALSERRNTWEPWEHTAIVGYSGSSDLTQTSSPIKRTELHIPSELIHVIHIS